MKIAKYCYLLICFGFLVGSIACHWHGEEQFAPTHKTVPNAPAIAYVTYSEGAGPVVHVFLDNPSRTVVQPTWDIAEQLFTQIQKRGQSNEIPIVITYDIETGYTDTGRPYEQLTIMNWKLR